MGVPVTSGKPAAAQGPTILSYKIEKAEMRGQLRGQKLRIIENLGHEIENIARAAITTNHRPLVRGA